jgi:hypothetical protein
MVIFHSYVKLPEGIADLYDINMVANLVQTDGEFTMGFVVDFSL